MDFGRIVNQVKRRLRPVSTAAKALSTILLRRLKQGPRQPGWTWRFEFVVEFMKLQLARALEIEHSQGPVAARQYLDDTGGSILNSDRNLREIEDAPVPLQNIQAESDLNDVHVLYLHGGGYGIYPNAYSYILPKLARRIQTSMWIPDYRLAPEHPFPAALEDARECYFWLITHRDITPSSLIVMGDSAGGNLMLALLISLRNNEEPLPAMGVGISPWTDLRNRGESFRINKEIDYINKKEADRMARKYAGNRLLSDPLISPVEADLNRLPPLYIQAGESECLHDMIKHFVKKARNSGVEVKFDTWEEMVHVFPLFYGLQPEVSEAQQRIRKQISEHTRR